MIRKLRAGRCRRRARGGPTKPRSRTGRRARGAGRRAGRPSAAPGRRTLPAPEPRGVRAHRSSDLLALDVNAGDYLPLDAKSANFDNIADAQLLSPTLMQAYLTAAAEISRLAVGDRAATAREATYPRVALDVAARARGGRAVRHARRGVGRAHVPGRRRATGSACPSITRRPARCTATAARRCTRRRRPSRSRSRSTARASRCSTSTAG